MANSKRVAPIKLEGTGPGVGEVLAGVTNDLTAYIRAENESGARLSTEFQQLRGVAQAQTDAVKGNTAAVAQNTTALAASLSGGTSGGSGLKTVGKAIGAGLTLSPLIKGIASLFGGGGEKTLPALTTYTQPPSMNFEGEIVRSAAAASTSGATAALKTATAETAGAPAAASAPQITVQVQAMDSRSFLDHKDEIAQAVRAAMLNSHSLNDVVSEL